MLTPSRSVHTLPPLLHIDCYFSSLLGYYQSFAPQSLFIVFILGLQIHMLFFSFVASLGLS